MDKKTEVGKKGSKQSRKSQMQFYRRNMIRAPNFGESPELQSPLDDSQSIGTLGYIAQGSSTHSGNTGSQA